MIRTGEEVSAHGRSVWRRGRPPSQELERRADPPLLTVLESRKPRAIASCRYTTRYATPFSDLAVHSRGRECVAQAVGWPACLRRASNPLARFALVSDGQYSGRASNCCTISSATRASTRQSNSRQAKKAKGETRRSESWGSEGGGRGSKVQGHR